MNSRIDFSLLWDRTEGYAVHCQTIEEAELFVESAKKLYPQMCSMWSPGELRYGQHGSKTIYTFDSKISGVWKKLQLMYGSVNAARDIGYTVVEFSEIYQEEDIVEADVSLDVLFG